MIELTGGGVDHAFEAIGLKATAEQAFQMLRKGGTATVIGMIPFGERIEIDGFQLLLEKRIQGSNMGSNRFRIDMPQYIEWYLAGRLKLDELVSAVIPLEQINDGFAALRGRRGRSPARHVRLAASPLGGGDAARHRPGEDPERGAQRALGDDREDVRLLPRRVDRRPVVVRGDERAVVDRLERVAVDVADRGLIWPTIVHAISRSGTNVVIVTVTS